MGIAAALPEYKHDYDSERDNIANGVSDEYSSNLPHSNANYDHQITVHLHCIYV